MKFKTTFLIIILAIILAFSFITTEKELNKKPDNQPPTQQEQPPKDEGPSEGGAITIGVQITDLRIDPLGFLMPNTAINNIDTILYRGLFKYNDKLELVPDLADSSAIDEGSKTINIVLKDGLKFADGNPVTLDDVKATYEFYSDTFYYGKWKDYTFDINGSDLFRTRKSSEISGIILNQEKNSIQIQYASLNSKNLQLLTAPILEKAQLAGKTVDQVKNESLNGNLIGAGPFQLNSIAAKEWILTKNPNFEDKVYLNKITFSNIKQGKNYDFSISLPQHVNHLNEDMKLIKMTGEGYQYLGMNLNNDDLKDISVRHAISLAIDYQNIIKDVFDGYAERPTSTIYPTSWAYAKTPIENTNINKAKELIGNKSLHFQLVYSNTLIDSKLAKKIKEQLKTIGITVDLIPIAPNQYISKLFSKGAYDLFLGNWPYELDPVFENGKWLSKNDVLLGGYNVSHVNDNSTDSLLQNGANTIDMAVRSKIYNDWQKHFDKQYFIIQLPTQQNLYVYNKNLNLKLTNSLVPYNDIQNWWLKK